MVLAKNLLIVESPAKAKTINKYLGKDFQVLASYGHVRDLVPKEGAVDPERGFAMRYDLIEKNEKHVAAIAKAAKAADAIYLATDPDREGEAISWHVVEILRERGLLEDKPVHRVVFTEITPRAIREAMAHPRQIAGDLVDAQQARRALDYLVGFNLSPVLWRKVQRGLSAGRVQSPALRMIVEREEEIEAFVAREYWSIEAECAHPTQAFTAKLTKLDGRKFEQFTVTDGESAEAARKRIVTAAGGVLQVTDVASKERKRRPAPPFTTSTLQQEAARKLGFTTRRTMQVAQKLYEGVNIGEEGHGRPDQLHAYRLGQPVGRGAGRTARRDRARLRHEGAAGQAELLPDQVQERAGGARGGAPDLGAAHAAAGRPLPVRRRAPPVRTGVEARGRLADGAGHLNTVSVDLAAGNEHGFRASGTTVVDPGFLAVYEEGKDTKAADAEDEGRKLPAMKPGERIPLERIHADQHFTQPPPRFTEAALVKALEEYGIGRPSTYASIIQTLLFRKYARWKAAASAERRRPRGQQLPVQPLHPLRRLRLHREDGGRAGRGLARRAGLGAADGEVLAPFKQLVDDKTESVDRSEAHRRARSGHRSEDRQAGQRAPGPLRAVRPDRQQAEDEDKPKFASCAPARRWTPSPWRRRSSCSSCRATWVKRRKASRFRPTSAASAPTSATAPAISCRSKTSTRTMSPWSRPWSWSRRTSRCSSRAHHQGLQRRRHRDPERPLRPVRDRRQAQCQRAQGRRTRKN
jgi:DNA topoisomerase I